MIAEYLLIYEPLHIVAMKVNAAMEHVKQLTADSLTNQCGDEEGNIRMTAVLEVVKVRREHKKEKDDEMAL